MGRNKKNINLECGKRLKQLIQEKGYKNVAFARKINCSPQQLSYMINGRRSITRDTVEEICKKFPDVNGAWLSGFDAPPKREAANAEIGERIYTLFRSADNLIESAARALNYEVERVAREGSAESGLYFILKNKNVKDKDANNEQPIELYLDEVGDLRDAILVSTVGLLNRCIRKKRDLPSLITEQILRERDELWPASKNAEIKPEN